MRVGGTLCTLLAPATCLIGAGSTRRAQASIWARVPCIAGAVGDHSAGQGGVRVLRAKVVASLRALRALVRAR